MTYIDQKGVHRKQTSWENWRDKSIDPIALANTPQSGFILNKDIQRYGYFSGRSMIRIYDPRGVEFEITPANLLYILMNTNCYKRELEEEFVYAWDTVKELIVKWFDWIDKHYAWHHELLLDLKKYCKPYQKQHFFRDAFNCAYVYEQAYNTHLRGSVVF